MMRHLLLLGVGLVVVVPARSDELADKFPDELVKFVPHGKGPVFAGRGPGHWDVKIRERGWILKEGDLYRMWYTGYDGTREGIRLLGYATSEGGIEWKRHAKNPFLADHWVEDMMVVRHGGKYYMFAEGRHDRAQLLVSDDGIDWTRLGKLDIRKKDGQPIADGPYGTPTALRDNDTWYLLYERNDLGIWLATSKDLKVWHNVRDEPVMTPGPAEYDRDLIAMNQVIKYKGRYYGYYHGSAKSGPNKGLWSTAVATSTDLLHWEKYPGNPLQPVRENKSSGILVHDGQRFRLYTMHPEVILHFPKNK